MTGSGYNLSVINWISKKIRAYRLSSEFRESSNDFIKHVMRSSTLSSTNNLSAAYWGVRDAMSKNSKAKTVIRHTADRFEREHVRNSSLIEGIKASR